MAYGIGFQQAVRSGGKGNRKRIRPTRVSDLPASPASATGALLERACIRMVVCICGCVLMLPMLAIRLQPPAAHVFGPQEWPSLSPTPTTPPLTARGSEHRLASSQAPTCWLASRAHTTSGNAWGAVPPKSEPQEEQQHQQPQTPSYATATPPTGPVTSPSVHEHPETVVRANAWQTPLMRKHTSAEGTNVSQLTNQNEQMGHICAELTDRKNVLVPHAVELSNSNGQASQKCAEMPDHGAATRDGAYPAATHSIIGK